MAKKKNNLSKEFYDVVIVGAGPAGLTAGVYAARYKLKTLIIGELPGGLISEAYEVCDFPTYEKILGMELSNKMIDQVKKNGVEIKPERVESIEKENDLFKIKTYSEEYQAKKVILAIGTERRKLNALGEIKFIGKGVSYCATCDAPFYKGKVVAVVGGSDASLTAALLLAEYAKKVYIIYRRDKFFRAMPAWIEQVRKNKKIEPIFKANIKEIYGKEFVEGVKLDTLKDLKLDGVFIEIGSVPEKKLSEKLGLKTEDGYVVVNKRQETNIKGIYAAGDITNNPLKQAVTACGEGAVAASSVFEDIKMTQE